MEKKYVISKEEQAVNRIKELYQQMIHTDAADKEYRAKLAIEVINLQKTDGSFSVINDYNCDSDIRVAYVYFPTYYATAALMFKANLDGMCRELEAPMENGLLFATGRNLMGHGFTGVAQQLQTLNIYKDAGLYQWLTGNPKVCEKFNLMIKGIIEGYQNMLSQKNTISDWNVDFAEQFQQEVDAYGDATIRYVWYAAYGSNICFDRFMEYIQGCNDKTPPIKSKPITIPHNIYFAYRSTKWEQKGVAFLDDSQPGLSLGRMYLITAAQFADIQRMEGSIYSKQIELGTDDSIPVFTFSSPTKRTDVNVPSAKYVQRIMQGLKETYPQKSVLVLQMYLYSRGVLAQDDALVLQNLRSAAHGVSIASLIEAELPAARVKKAITKLISLELIVQDGRNVAAGHSKQDLEAIYYTHKDKRDFIDFLLLSF